MSARRAASIGCSTNEVSAPLWCNVSIGDPPCVSMLSLRLLDLSMVTGLRSSLHGKVARAHRSDNAHQTYRNQIGRSPLCERRT